MAIHTFPPLDGHDALIAIIQLYIDSTEPLKLKKQIKSSVKRFKSLIENSDTAILYYNLATKKLYFANRAFRELFKFREFDLHRRPAATAF